MGDPAADLAVQGTNTSSITSKRSLERLGYLQPCHVEGATEKDSPLMLKYVVQKPSRRSPVINRSYYYRTETIRLLVEGWIQECETLGMDNCAVISLGCGFDPTFFRLKLLQERRETRTKLKYIDIDYPTLIMERLYMVRNQEKLFDLLPENPSKDDVAEFVSDTYSCLGVDLRNLNELEKRLEEAGITKKGGQQQTRMPILVVSEVVLAYLEAEESDAVIKFFADFPEATFVLHEQCIPTFDVDEQGNENLHPFALTMFRHFERTMTPLKTLREYMSIEDQRDRFQELGWPNCEIMNMNLMADLLVTPNESDHLRISQLEPFDEYDEQHWIGSYYFTAVASTGPKEGVSVPTRSPDVLRGIGLSAKLQHALFMTETPMDKSSYISIDHKSASASSSQRSIVGSIKWAGEVLFPGLDINRKGHSLTILGDYAYAFGGFGLDASDGLEDQRIFRARSQQTRLATMLRINLQDGTSQMLPRDDDEPAPRMHHSAVSTLNGSTIYMYGGRDGPTKVHNDVWRFTPENGWDPIWRARVNPMSNHRAPSGLFKHTANMMVIDDKEMMVVYGGRNGAGEANETIWAFVIPDNQWVPFMWRSSERQPKYKGIFSHSSVVVKDEDQRNVLLVIGGIHGKDEKVLNSVTRVTMGRTLNIDENTVLHWAEADEISLQEINDNSSAGRSSNSGDHAHVHSLFKPRFGHTSVAVDEDRILVIGGVSSPGLLLWQETVVEIRLKARTFQYLRPSSFRELVMVNHATVLDNSRNRIIGIGGGGTCFGFGAWWDAVGWALKL
ncbi:Leucine carboxyl methyltransferase 2 [Lobosporangium transversale]|uniref:tRNA wybutosine-synthesizing protein 4 n=1 Tax=Lobosporangium transversale TaxID=64571 RepID=A0A1Y2GVW1_9FUNG|nr:S-adenosyl-L-methionine-dependent methyltransferase [Lobosporangium transversale]KAF9915328.1 Leucine carboxyl methyltransferase 2 [Lobosporangium transversale]ORZ22844.1 S-adenosyl-L-methionine-dependent methyltransferase [Lobosporangium transversale]|eukprot:XP_021883398.1 S-adenosyl-L-methionine-dependent methyltransferase [Lobosporangium transversale]